MRPATLLIRGGLVIDPAGRVESVRDVLVENGRISAVRPSIRREGARVLDAKGCWVLPGIIDMHVHLREPGQEESETVATGSRAAAAGGVCTVLTMPNTRPPIDSPAAVRRVRAGGRAAGLINVLAAAAVTKGQQGRRMTDMEGLAAAGAGAFSEDGRPVMDAELMRRALRKARALGLPILDHAEDTALAAGGVLHEGPASRRFRVPGIPSASESLMAARDIALAAATGGRLHICHVSCAETVRILRRAKRRGLPVTGEAAPHHFTLCEDDIPRRAGPYRRACFKMNPPLRSRTDREAVLEGLADGTLDAIATDHAPHARALKSRGLRKAPFGVIGLETLLPLSLRLVEERVLGRRRLAELLSLRPARILGLRSKGALRPGSDGDVTVVDPSARWTVSSRFLSKSSNSPFVGLRLKGLARATVVGGRVVFQRDHRGSEGGRS